MNKQVFPCLSEVPHLDVPIVLFHGWGVNARSWGPLITYLQQWSSVEVMTIDYSVYLADDAIDGDQLSGNDRVDRFCDHLYQLLSARCVLFGWSLGGMLATRIAARYPDTVVGLITLASNAKFVANAQWASAMLPEVFDGFYKALQNNSVKTLRRFMALMVNGDVCAKEQRRYLNAADNTQYDEQRLVNGLQLLRDCDNRSQFANIDCPTLHCFGENDQLVPIATSERIHALNPRHYCHILSDRGHLLHMPNQQLLPILDTFLSPLSRHISLRDASELN